MSTPTGSRVIARVLPDTHSLGGNVEGPGNDRGQRRGRGSSRGASRGASGASRAARAASTVMIALLMALVTFSGFTGSTQTATAGPIDSMKKFICGISDETPGARADNGMEALYGGRAPSFKSGQEGALTAYEDYGLMGMYWSNYDQETDGCFDNMVNNMLAAEIFNGANLLTGVTVSTFAWATDGDLLDSFTDPLTCVVAGCDGGKGLKDTLFLTYLLPVIVLGAVWAAWNGLFKKRTMHTTQGIVWMLCATTFSLIFLAQPGLIADKSNEVIGGITANITNGVTGITSSTVTKSDPCYLPTDSKDRGNRIAACSMWKAMMFTPWVTGQFGTAAHKPIPGVEATIQGHDKAVDDIRLAQLDAQTNSGGDDTDENEGQWESVRDKVMNGEAEGVDAALWQGEEGSHRLTVALSSLVAAICLGALVVVISFATVVMSVGMILLIIVAPIFLLVGIHPGFGRGIALKWLELLLGTMFKRIVLAAMLSILIGMYQVILAAPMPWLSQIALIIAMGVGVFVFRKPMLDTLNVVQLGGSATGMEAGLQREAKQATGGTIGAVAGGLAASRIGGMDAMVKGAVKGGIAGSRSGSPMRAASIGHGAGRRVGTRDRSEDAREEREDGKRKKTAAAGTTRPGTKDTAEREAQQARAQDQQWVQQQPSLDEVLAGAESSGGAGASVPRPSAQPGGSLTREEWEAMDTQAQGQHVAQGGVIPHLPEASGAPQGGATAGAVPRPVGAPSTATTMPAPPTGLPAAPAGLPTSAGVPTPVPSTDTGSAPASRLPTVPPPVPATDRREAAAPAAAAPAQAPATGHPQAAGAGAAARPATPPATQPGTAQQQPPHPTVQPTIPTPDSQPGQGGRPSAPPRPQS